jgi:hypothetical protein
VQQDRQHLVAARIAAPMLARAHGSFDHGIHDLEVRRIEGQREVDRAAGVDTSDENPWWYFTSPAGSSCAALPSNSENRFAASCPGC